MNPFLRIKRSFSARISLFIISIVGVIFVIAFGICYYYSAKAIEKAAIEKARLTLQNATSSIESVLTTVSKSVDNVRDVSRHTTVDPDSLYHLVSYFISRNDNIMGSAVAFEPNFYPEKGYYYSPYAYKDSGRIFTKQLGTDTYDYFAMEWYQVPKESGENHWTSPYYDEGGGGEIMTTYSARMVDENGNFTGVVTADIYLEWLNDLAQSTKTYEHAYTFVLDTRGTYIIHLDSDRIFNESIFSIAEKEDNPLDVKALGNKMLAGESGFMRTFKNGKLTYVFYQPIPTTRWSMAVVCSAEDIFCDLNKVTRQLIIFAIVGLLLIFFACWLTIRRLSKPLISFAGSAKKIAHGDFNTELPTIKSKDEMKELYNSFDYMQKELVRYIDSLEDTVSAKEKIESELRIARNIQLGMLPKIFPPFPERNDIDLFAVLRPAKEVGGDLYDFFINEEKLYFTVGDVSGKGVPASLFMAVTRSLFRSIATTIADPKRIIESMNHAIAETNEENMFVTMFVGVLDLPTGNLKFCNAGHNPPCIIAPNGDVTFMPLKQNLPIGIFVDFEYENQEMHINEGDTIFLYTDGLTEAENGAKELYGDERMLDVLKGEQLTDSVTLLKKVYDSVEEHVQEAPQSDDLTMLVVKYNGHLYEKQKTIKRLVLTNQVAELTKLAAFVEEIGEDNGFDMPLTMSLNLAMEEAVSNVIFYAYPKGECNHTIEVLFSKVGSEICFVIRDSGIYFDPTAKEDADITLSAEERQIGGLGIYMVKQIMDSVTYIRESEMNILTMKKNIEK